MQNCLLVKDYQKICAVDLLLPAWMRVRFSEIFIVRAKPAKEKILHESSISPNLFQQVY